MLVLRYGRGRSGLLFILHLLVTSRPLHLSCYYDHSAPSNSWSVDRIQSEETAKEITCYHYQGIGIKIKCSS